MDDPHSNPHADASAGKCPVDHGQGAAKNAGGDKRRHGNRDWWPKQLDVQMLHNNSAKSDPMGADFNYAEEFKKLDLAAIKADPRFEEMALLKYSRLSVQPVTDAEWKMICKLGGL